MHLRKLLHRVAPLVTSLALAIPAIGEEPRWDASLELGLAEVGSVDHTALGAGLRLSYRMTEWLAADAGVQLAPADLGTPPFSSGQTELLGGLRAGPKPDPFGYFGTLRAGAVLFGEAPGPLACIAIFPPPLECELTDGHSAFTLQFGAGVERLVATRGLFRLEVGDRMVRLPGPVFEDGEVHDGDFWSHELRLAVSFGLRF